MKKQLYFLVFCIPMFIFSSCMKEQEVLPQTTDLQKINVSSDFNWSTGKVVALHIMGLPTVLPVFSSLIVSVEDGNILYQGRHEMSKNLTLKVVVPNQVQSLNVRYGSMDYLLSILKDEATLSFIPEIQD